MPLLWIRHRQPPSNYIPNHTPMFQNRFGSYLVMDYIEESEGQMLSKTWNEYRGDEKRLTNLFNGLSRLRLVMSRIKLTKIGSFTVDDNGLLRLANRPLTSMLQESENTGIPMHIVRDCTYTSVIAYVTDLLSYHDNQLRHNLNAVKAPQFYNHDSDAGLFAFSLTDLHQSNIFVDKDWNITHIIDLEWAASLPVEFIQLPHWLGGKEIDAIDLDSYKNNVEEFTRILEESKRSLALRSPPALHSLFYDRIQPQFAAQHLKDQEFYKVVGFYRCREASAFIRAKCNDKKTYDIQLREAFQMNT
ncbi:hypothetical protein ACJ73_05963 [Blastomyces percursus]|uniref:Aminoglycoside phosphotransferase domain-containing protein n=1 Tax=Blastomyces percursus TaxID=1658174 RepID=A0A1J9Q3M1_9EURO|nr:hypothetical protein ACJ73_05963 [Blastomyces percursus]